MDTFPSIAESRRTARRLMRRRRSNFYRPVRLLPSAKRNAMFGIYAFARHTDDLGDCAASPAIRLAALRWWRDATRAALQDRLARVAPCAVDAAFPVAVRTRFCEMLPALREAADRYDIPPEYLIQVVDGVIASQRKTRFDTFEQLEHYCDLVTSSVGMVCLYIWGFRGEVPRSAVGDCGLAFQLTNCLRDLTEDSAAGNIYLPRQHYEQHGLVEDDLLMPRSDDRLVCLIREEAERAAELFASGWRVWDSLEPDGRPIFSMMWHTYHALLRRIRDDPACVLRRRIGLSPWTRLRLWADHAVPGRFRRLELPKPERRPRRAAEAAG